MRFILIIIVAVVCFSSCRNETDSTVTDHKSADSATVLKKEVITEPPYTVEYNDNTQGLNLIRGNKEISGFDAADVVRVMNKKYDGIKLDLVHSGSDTVALKINDATKLTQGMGSMGAEAYLAELTFSITELNGVKAIKIDFEEGDHAMPGVYTRADFGDLMKKK